jgi:CBS domain-containing protein
MTATERIARRFTNTTTEPRPLLRLVRRSPAPARETSRLGWFVVAALAAPLAMMMLRRARRGGRVEDVMVEDVVTIDGGATLGEAAQRMRDANVGILPVIEDGRVRGVITDRDLVVRGMARGLDPARAHVTEAATRNPVCARPEWSLDRALRVMADEQVGRLPVCDADERVVGMVTLSSVALRAREDEEALETAQQVSRRSARG